ncbi:hypothetical protein ACGFSB_34025 [Streptomyces sp. NPDC048441]|uniref:hypothetical protein n=1 Tax=Streptomyces sp. NPDC048441 TaxID=3365552 RepID=UPI00371DA374
MEFHSCPRNHAQEVRTAAGSALCVSCIRRLERNLRALPGLHQECLHQILPTPRRRNLTKVSGSRKRDHLNMSALDARNDILAVLGSWSGFVAEKLGTVAPDRFAPQLACFLVRHLEWLAAQPSAADFADEIEDLHVELLRAIDPETGDRPTHIRACVVDGCPGKINASPQHAGNAGKSSISCSAGHSWDIREWLTLRHLMDRQREDAA